MKSKKPRLSSIEKAKNRPSILDLKKSVWTEFTLFIKARDNNICFTCGKPGNQGGHYISSKYNNTLFDERNVNCQCVHCNIFLKGNLSIYAIKLIEKYGAGILQELHEAHKIGKKFSHYELIGMRAYYKQETKKLKEDL